MPAFQRCARSLPSVRRTEERARELTGQISLTRCLLATRATQRGCVSHTMPADGKEWRRAATAGKVWTISPSEPRRTTAKRGSGIRAFPDGVEKATSGMVFRVADNSYANTKPRAGGPLRHGVGGVVGAFGVDIGTQILEEFCDVGFRENDHVVDIADRRNQLCAGLLVENGPAGTFQARNTRIRVDGDDQDVAFALCPGEIADVADVQRVEATVRQYDGQLFRLVAGGCGDRGGSIDDFVLGGPHVSGSRLRGSVADGVE